MPDKKIIKLKIEKAKEEDFLLLGISSSYDDYKLIWECNKELSLHFQKDQDITLEKRSVQQNFTHYQYEDQVGGFSLHFIKNNCEQGTFLEKFNNFDYLIRMKGLTQEKSENLKNKIQALAGVRFVSFIPLSGIKEIERLYF